MGPTSTQNGWSLANYPLRLRRGSPELLLRVLLRAVHVRGHFVDYGHRWLDGRVPYGFLLRASRRLLLRPGALRKLAGLSRRPPRGAMQRLHGVGVLSCLCQLSGIPRAQVPANQGRRRVQERQDGRGGEPVRCCCLTWAFEGSMGKGCIMRHCLWVALATLALGRPKGSSGRPNSGSADSRTATGLRGSSLCTSTVTA